MRLSHILEDHSALNTNSNQGGSGPSNGGPQDHMVQAGNEQQQGDESRPSNVGSRDHIVQPGNEKERRNEIVNNIVNKLQFRHRKMINPPALGSKALGLSNDELDLIKNHIITNYPETTAGKQFSNGTPMGSIKVSLILINNLKN
jgi:hypothetical protein